jgi:hypothetical protein
VRLDDLAGGPAERAGRASSSSWLLYSVTQRRLHLAVLGQSAGLPSLHAAVGGALLTLCVAAHRLASAEVGGRARLHVVITVFDAMRIRAAAQQQRRLVHDLVLAGASGGTLAAAWPATWTSSPTRRSTWRRASLWGFLFALALGTV